MLVENDPFVGGEMSKMLPERHRTFDENFFDNLELSSGKRVDKAPGTGSDSTQSRVGPGYNGIACLGGVYFVVERLGSP